MLRLEEGRQEDWYSNKELYEMMIVLSKGLEATNAELGKTQILIRDYNGLRKDVGDVKIKIDTNLGVNKRLQWWATFAVAVAAVVVAVWR